AAPRSRSLPPAGGGLGVRRTVGRASRLLVISIALLAVGSLGTLQVLQSSRVAGVGYEIRALESERSNLSAAVAQLEAQVATRSNLERVHTEAVARLGMVRPAEIVSVSVSVEVAVPPVVPLPRRYVAPTDAAAVAGPGWLERFMGTLPGFN
ncbi:MAG: hypothetical protein O3B31_09365, partial [Chloroflexi bacterium]|nr:hypothetical protein [Chloroflexota bacterium]